MVKGSTMETWCPVYASSQKKHDLFELWRVRADGSGGWRM